MFCEPQFWLLLPELRGNLSKTEKRMRALEKCTNVVIAVYMKRKNLVRERKHKERKGALLQPISPLAWRRRKFVTRATKSGNSAKAVHKTPEKQGLLRIP